MRYTRTRNTTEAPIDLSSLKAFMRVDHSDEDVTISLLSETAVLEIEAAADIALLSQTITTTTGQWPGCMIDLPCGPLLEGEPVTVEVVETDGSLTPVVSGFWMEGGRYPRLHFTTTPGASLRITYVAGYGQDQDNIPQDLQHALRDHTLRLYSQRNEEGDRQGLSPAAARILSRYRRVRA